MTSTNDLRPASAGNVKAAINKVVNDIKTATGGVCSRYPLLSNQRIR